MDNDQKPKSTGEKPTDKKSSPQGGNLVWYMLGLGVLLLLMVTMFNKDGGVTLGFSDLLKLIDVSGKDSNGKASAGFIDVPDPTTARPQQKARISDISDIEVGSTAVKAKVTRQHFTPNASGGIPTEKEVATAPEIEKNMELHVERLPEDQSLTDLLRKRGLPWKVAGPPNPLLNYVPLLLMTGLLVMLFIFMIRRMGGAGSPMAFGRSRGKLFAQEEIEITFEDVAGIEEAVDELREVVEFLKTPEKYQMLGGRIPKGVLLVGPPGTGKTLLAKAVAGEAGVPFFSLSGSDFVEMFVGVGAARVRDMFQQAEQKAPCIIFIDELDALGKTRGSGNIGGHDEREQTLNALLVEMDGFNSNSGVIVMAPRTAPKRWTPHCSAPVASIATYWSIAPTSAAARKSSKSIWRISKSIPMSTSKRSPRSRAVSLEPTWQTWSTRPPCSLLARAARWSRWPTSMRPWSARVPGSRRKAG